MKIVFINPPAADVHLYRQASYFGSPLGLGLLAAYVRENGYEPTIIDAAAEELADEETVDRVAEVGASVVGITANTVMIPPATRIAALLQERLPEALVVLGGNHVSVASEDLYDGRPVVFDVSVLGEGEETLLEILLSAIRLRESGAARPNPEPHPAAFLSAPTLCLGPHYPHSEPEGRAPVR